MSLFNWFKRKPAETTSSKTEQQDEMIAQKMVQFAMGKLRDKDGRIRAEDVICVLATIAGERCIEAAGDFNPRDHQFAPGSRVFSDKVNVLLAGEGASDKLQNLPASSVIGLLRDRLVGKSYQEVDFPPLPEIFKGFAAGIGNPADWGKVPLSVGADNQPYVLPLRVAYESRAAIDQILQPLNGDKARSLRVSVIALSEILKLVRQAISPNVALLLAIETVNGMSKTAPMTDRAMQNVTKESKNQPGT